MESPGSGGVLTGALQKVSITSHAYKDTSCTAYMEQTANEFSFSFQWAWLSELTLYAGHYGESVNCVLELKCHLCGRERPLTFGGPGRT